MNEEQQLKLQAFVDGELPEAEARGVAAELARNSEATALLNELRLGYGVRVSTIAPPSAGGVVVTAPP